MNNFGDIEDKYVKFVNNNAVDTNMPKTLDYLQAMSIEDLKKTMAQQQLAIDSAKEQMEETPAYISAKQVIKDERYVYNCVARPAKLTIDAASDLLKSRGQR